MGNDYVSDNFNSASLSSDWTAEYFSVKSGCLSRDNWGSPDMLPATAYYSKGITKGNAEIKANVVCGAGGQLGLLVLMADQGSDGYEFRIDRYGSPETAQIVKWEQGVDTVLATAAMPVITENKFIRLRGKIESLDYENWDSGVRLSLFFDNEQTALLTYSDRMAPVPRGDGYIGLRAMTSPGITWKVDNVVLRRLLNIEIPKNFEMPLWSWDRLADSVRWRLERGGNPQLSREKVLELLGFAEQEIVKKCGEPWWLRRVYQLTTDTMLNDMPIWVERIQDAIQSGKRTPIAMKTREEFNVLNCARTKTGTPNMLVFMGLNDDGSCQYALYPAPTGSLTITTYVIARPGYIADSGLIPLVPPEHVEVLVFGALRRAARYDVDPRVVTENDQMWQEARLAIIRDHKRKTQQGARIIRDREYRGQVRKRPWYVEEGPGPGVWGK